MKFIKYFFIFVITLTFFSFISNIASAQLDTPASLNFTPEVGIPGSEFQDGKSINVGQYIATDSKMSSDLLARYIQAIYNYGLAIVAILAAIVLMGGGLLWLTSGGDNGRISKAKEMIIGSISGLVILFCAWIILNTVNPALLELKSIDTIVIVKKVYGCCQQGNRGIMTNADKCTNGVFDKDKSLNQAGQCEGEICCVSNFSIAGADFNYCFQTFAVNCKGSKSPGKCSAVTSCGQANSKPMSCAGVDNGNAPTGFISQSGSPFFCYNEKVYPATGELGEPCGTKGNNEYGICIKISDKCSDKNQVGGRECNSTNAKCCLDDGIW